MRRISNSYLEFTGAAPVGLLVTTIDYPPIWGVSLSWTAHDRFDDRESDE